METIYIMTRKILMVLMFISLGFISLSRAQVNDGTNSRGQGTQSLGRDCGYLTTTASRAKIFRTENGSAIYTHKFYDRGEQLLVHRIVGNYAEVEFPNGAGLIPRRYFNKAAFDKLKQSCIYSNQGVDRSILDAMARHQNNRVARNGRGGVKPLNVAINGRLSAKHQNQFNQAICTIKKFKRNEGRNERYAFVNLPNGYKFLTILVDLQTGREVDRYDTLKSYKRHIGNDGIGCARDATRPGIFKLSNKYRPSPDPLKTWWGPRRPAYEITNIGGHQTQYGGGGNHHLCKMNYTIKAHANVNMRGASSNGARYSAGCLVGSWQKYNQHTVPRAKANDSLIFNVDPKRIPADCRNSSGAR